ncbi:MAG: lipopolysaccharide heptosyltransferase II [Candidatus Schekmanbacteria bacterium]|nr:lipopolysaccharide heptosyltransferase II [Candidatus Schekmanbacteria bacterium]
MSKITTQILIKAPNWVGDALLCTPALNALGRVFPQKSITVLAAPWVAPVLQTHQAVKEIILYDPSVRHRSWTKRLQIIKQLRSQHFDLAIFFPNSFHSALIGCLAGIPRRLGYDTDGRKLLLTEAIPCTAACQQLHQADYYLGLVQALGIEINPQDQHLVLNLDQPERLWAEDFLPQEKLESKRLVAVHPGAIKPGKRWPYKRFVRLGQELINRYNSHLLWLGSHNERTLLETIKQEINSPAQSIICGTGLRNVAALLTHCRLFIGNDSGLMHLATAVGVPLIGIFGPGTPITTAPYHPIQPYAVILKEFPCRPCRQHFFTECQPSPDGTAPCLAAIEVDDVLTEVEKLGVSC